MPRKNIKDATAAREREVDGKNRSVTLVLTKDCNLSCTYCYEKQDLRSKRAMTLSTAQDSIKYYLDADDEFHSVVFEFFGGEPFLEFQLMKDIVSWTTNRQWKKHYHFMIGTNATILNDEIKEWLLAHRPLITVGISIDGTKEAHDLCRDNSYDLVRQNLSFFMENWPNQPAKMTICTDTIPYVAQSVIELEEMGVYFTANMGFEDMWGNAEEKEKLLNLYKEQLDQLVEYYSGRPHLSPVSPIMDAVPQYLGLSDSGDAMRKNNDLKRFCGAGHEMVVVDTDGETYPCHRFLPWITGMPAPENGANCQMCWEPETCANCKLVLSCPTCAGYNWEVHKDTGKRTDFHCKAFKAEVLASSKLEAVRLSQKFQSLDTMSVTEKQKLKTKLEAVWNLLENGV